MKLLDRFETAKNTQQGTGNSRPRSAMQMLAVILSLALVFTTCPESLLAFQDQQSNAPADGQDQSNAPADDQSGQPSGPPSAQTPARTPETPDQLQQLVAPIALYPDSLVAQILAASTYPTQVVEADRWLQAHPELKGDDLAKAVDQQSWDPSVKALTAFPTVLGNMDKNISWTSELGDSYFNQEQDVMDAIQFMRQKAQQAGNLKDTPQQKVETKDSNIVIEPAYPDVVYVPAYDPWLVYGYPIVAWPGWYPYPGIWFGGPSLFFGVGFGIGFYGGYGWGWGRWGFDWRGRSILYNHDRYYSRSRVFYNRNAYYRGERPGFNGRAGAPNRPFNGDNRAARGFDDRAGGGRPAQGVRPGNAPRGGGEGGRPNAFGGFGRGGEARGEAARGGASMRGGGGGRGGRR
ncbi:MAG: DUF3300 domain-containing protein [Candidatus Acidiferrales bacterium]